MLVSVSPIARLVYITDTSLSLDMYLTVTSLLLMIYIAVISIWVIGKDILSIVVLMLDVCDLIDLNVLFIITICDGSCGIQHRLITHITTWYVIDNQMSSLLLLVLLLILLLLNSCLVLRRVYIFRLNSFIWLMKWFNEISI